MLEELQMMKDSIAAQGSVIAAQNQRLDLLAPVQAQVIFIRKPDKIHIRLELYITLGKCT